VCFKPLGFACPALPLPVLLILLCLEHLGGAQVSGAFAMRRASQRADDHVTDKAVAVLWQPKLRDVFFAKLVSALTRPGVEFEEPTAANCYSKRMGVPSWPHCSSCSCLCAGPLLLSLYFELPYVW